MKILTFTFRAQNNVNQLLQNISTSQEEDPRILQIKQQQPLNNNYTVHNNILFKLIKQEWKVVLSQNMLDQLIIPCHESLAHASARRCNLTLQEDFYIRNMYRKIVNAIKGCYDCQTSRQPNRHVYVPMQNVIAKKKGDILAIDFLGPMPRSNRGVKHILVCVDVFTKAVRLYAIMRPTTKTVLKILLQKYIPSRVSSFKTAYGEKR